MNLTDIYIYPIKSLGGIRLTTSRLNPRGLENDRRFMLVDSDNNFMTQRSHREMALFRTAIKGPQLLVWHANQPANILSLPTQPMTFIGEKTVVVWDLESICQVLPKEINDWFSKHLKTSCELVYMPDTAERRMKAKYNPERPLISFADGAPVLLIGQASLANLNDRLDHPVSMNRFRPNLVFSGGKPFAEDNWKTVIIGEQSFTITHQCVRCNVPNINQETAAVEKEPNKTLATFRRFANKIYFGVNAVWHGASAHGQNLLSVGDSLVGKYS